MKWMLSQHAPDSVGLTRTVLYAFHGTLREEFPKIAVLWNVRAGVEPALDNFGILPASVYVMLPISERCQLSVLPIEHTAHHAPIILVRKTLAPTLLFVYLYGLTYALTARATPNLILILKKPNCPFCVCKGCAGLINIRHSPACNTTHRL